MNFAALKTELAARGFDYLTDARRGQFINDARAELDNGSKWPYREASVTGTAPLIVSDLGRVEAVTNESMHYQLRPGSYQALLDEFGDLSLTGLPVLFYVAQPAGEPVIATYATNGDTIGVQYWKRTPMLSADEDTPLAPADYHLLIVDMATVRAYMDRDNYQGAQSLQGWVDRRLAQMQNDLLAGRQDAGPQDSTALLGFSVDG